MKLTPALPSLATTPLALVFAFVIIAAPVTHAADRKGQPGRPPPPDMTLPQPPKMDPQTGLPLPPPRPWIDANWQEPDKVLPQVFFDGLPLSEVSRYLRDQFKDAFDVLIPSGWQDTAEQPRAVDPGSFTIKLQLKNVSASEVFNAMNLVLEGENTPARWELKMNGNRPTAVLRYLPDLLPRNPVMQAREEPMRRSITFVGDLLGDEKAGGMSIEELVKTISEVYEMSFGKIRNLQNGSRQNPIGKPDLLQFHKEAQLIIVNGTTDQIGFIQSTLSAIRSKVQQVQMQMQRRLLGGFGGGYGGPRPVEPNPNTDIPAPTQPPNPRPNPGAGSPAPTPRPIRGEPNPAPAPNPK
jgi:hypothetical protein